MQICQISGSSSPAGTLATSGQAHASLIDPLVYLVDLGPRKFGALEPKHQYY